MSEINLYLPTLHSGQLDAWKGRKRFNSLRCGRRWGKTQMIISIAGTKATYGEYMGVFAPDYKIMSETYRDLEEALSPVTAHSNKTDGIIRTINGGRIDFWTLNNPKAGRSRKYHGVLLDEAAFAGYDMADIWDRAIEPTLFDYQGWAWAVSTPNGNDPDNWFYKICNDKSLGWNEYHAPSNTNPYLSAEEFERIRSRKDPRVFQQEYLAEFVDWNGAAFFQEQYLLVDGKAVEYPKGCDQVFAVIDTALKDGIEHDGTAVIYCARNKIAGTPLIILDWDLIQIEGALLETWLPSVNNRLEELSAKVGSRHGSAGIWIEDAASGIVLLQKAQRHGLPAYPIDQRLVTLGKDGRALAVSDYVYRGEVKISDYAYNKTTNYRGNTRNHLLHQVCGYRMGNKTPHGMDGLDVFCYSIAISLGDSSGW